MSNEEIRALIGTGITVIHHAEAKPISPGDVLHGELIGTAWEGPVVMVREPQTPIEIGDSLVLAIPVNAAMMIVHGSVYETKRGEDGGVVVSLHVTDDAHKVQRRNSVRVPVHLEVRFLKIAADALPPGSELDASWHKKVSVAPLGRTENLSATGILLALRTDEKHGFERLEAGDHCLLQIELPDGKLYAIGVVRHTRLGHRVGMELRFVDRADERWLGRFLLQRQRMHHAAM